LSLTVAVAVVVAVAGYWRAVAGPARPGDFRPLIASALMGRPLIGRPLIGREPNDGRWA